MRIRRVAPSGITLAVMVGLFGCARFGFGGVSGGDAFRSGGDTIRSGGDAGPWYDPSWAYRKKVTVHAAQVAEDLTNFPVLVRVTDGDLAGHARADAGDVVFVADDHSTTLAYEIEAYDAGTGHLVAWVKVPVVSASADTIIWMYYGNPNATSQQDAAATWNAYRAVWHMNQTPTVDSSLIDSTGNGHDGAFQGNMVASDQQPGLVDGSLAFDGIDDDVDVPDADNLTFSNGSSDEPFSLEALVNMTDANVFKIINKGHSLPPVEYYLRTGAESGDQLFLRVYDSSGSYIGRSYSVGLTPMEGQWLHIVGTYDGSSSATGLKIYLNGAEVDDQDASSGGYAGMSNEAGDVYIGTYNYHAHGSIDEVRIKNSVDSPGWVATEYHNLSTPDQLVSVSAEQVQPN